MVPKAAVIPEGQPDAASVTAELKPFEGTTVTVDVALDPATAVAAVALRPKPGPEEAAFTVNESVVLADEAPLVPFTARL